MIQKKAPHQIANEKPLTDLSSPIAHARVAHLSLLPSPSLSQTPVIGELPLFSRRYSTRLTTTLGTARRAAQSALIAPVLRRFRWRPLGNPRLAQTEITHPKARRQTDPRKRMFAGCRSHPRKRRDPSAAGLRCHLAKFNAHFRICLAEPRRASSDQRTSASHPPRSKPIRPPLFPKDPRS